MVSISSYDSTDREANSLRYEDINTNMSDTMYAPLYSQNLSLHISMMMMMMMMDNKVYDEQK